MKDLEIPELCIEWELLNRTKNPITKRKIKKNGPTYKILKDVCKKESELFFPKNQKKQKINKKPDIFQKKNIACKKHILEPLTRAHIQTRPPQHVQESTSDPIFSTRSDVQTQTCNLEPLNAQLPLMLAPQGPVMERVQEAIPALEFTEHTEKICLPQNITKEQLKNISEEISGVLSTKTNDWPKKVLDILSPYERTQNVCLPTNITREQLKHITDEISGVFLNNRSDWAKKIEDIFHPYLTNYQNLKTRIQEANRVCTYLNKTVSIADQQWCVSGPDKQIFNTYIGSFNVLSNGTFGIVSKVYFKNLRTPIIIKEAKFLDEDNQVTTVKTIEGRFELQKKGKKDYFSLENLILEAIDRLILQPHRSPNFLLFYESTWCKNCDMVAKNTTFKPGSCYLTFMEAADTDLYRLELPSIYQQESVLYQILLGLHCLQKYLGLWHRDIKTDNIFIKQIQPGGVLKYNVDNEIYYVPNTGYLVYVSDFNVADCLKPDVLTKEYHSALQYNCYFHPCWIKYVNNKLVGVPLLNEFNKQSPWKNSKNQLVDLIPNPIPVDNMHKDPIQFPFYNFFGDIQDVIRMFTGGKRSEISLNQVTVKPELDEMYSRLMKAEAYIKKLPRITTKCVKYLLAKEMLKSLYKPPIKNSGKFRVIEEFTL